MGIMKTYLNGEQCEKEKEATGVLRKPRERMEEEYQEEESVGENVIMTLEKKINNTGSQGYAFQYGSPLSRENTGTVPQLCATAVQMNPVKLLCSCSSVSMLHDKETGEL